MPQFDVYRNHDAATGSLYPYLLVLQHDLLEVLDTRVVAPLIRAAEVNRPMTRLNPTFEVEGQSVVLSTQEVAGISRQLLGERVTSLGDRRDDILTALDLLFTGI